MNRLWNRADGHDLAILTETPCLAMLNRCVAGFVERCAELRDKRDKRDRYEGHTRHDTPGSTLPRLCAALLWTALACFAARPVAVRAAPAAGPMRPGQASGPGSNPAAPEGALPAPTVDEPASGSHREVAILAGGSFWGVQAVFQHVRGVSQAVSGYAGGTAGTARYEIVSSGTTRHAQAVAVVFDPTRISYGHILQIFFSVALDPTQINRQGSDIGLQYRSALFVNGPAQRQVALHYRSQLNSLPAFRNHPVATQVNSYTGFFPAEAYHQNFVALHPDDTYVRMYDLPKLDALKRWFPHDYRADPVLVEIEDN